MIAAYELLQVLEGLDGNPIKKVKPDLNAGLILLRERVDGRQKVYFAKN